MITADSVGLGEIIAAIGGLGLAAAALVDATKSLPGGGVSNYGFDYVRNLLARLGLAATEGGSGNDLDAALLPVLHSNWINGMVLGDQKAVARSLIKLQLTPDRAERFAEVTQVDAGVLRDIAERMVRGEAIAPVPASEEERSLVAAEEAWRANVLGRFDLALTALLDGAYQRADQRYRNVSKLWAGGVAVLLSLAGGFVLEGPHILVSLACGVLAVPLAPLTKDLTSAIQAGAKVAQAVVRRS